MSCPDALSLHSAQLDAFHKYQQKLLPQNLFNKFEASSNSQGPCRSPANADRKTAASEDLNNSDIFLIRIFSSSLKQLNFRFHPRHVPTQNPTDWWCLEFAFYSRPWNCISFSFLVNISALVWRKFASTGARESWQSAIIYHLREIQERLCLQTRSQDARTSGPAFPKYQKGSVHEKTFDGFHPTFGRE